VCPQGGVPMDHADAATALVLTVVLLLALLLSSRS
jgi:hypothetical protein